VACRLAELSIFLRHDFGCPYRKLGTSCDRSGCGPRLILSAAACPRCLSLCSPLSSRLFGRVSSSRWRFSPSGINSRYSNARCRGARVWVPPIACCRCCYRGCGRTGDGPSKSWHPTPLCAGIVAGSRSTGCGNHAREARAARQWHSTSGLSSDRCTRLILCGVLRASDGRVDRATAPRGVALGLRTAVRHSGSRRHLRTGCSGDDAGYGWVGTALIDCNSAVTRASA